jgi:sterol desaturase/sphingolipid hydroxylase (fatty acid hydroxylase superfamily)
MLFVLVLLRGLLRKEWAAAAAFVLLFTFLFAAGSQFAPVVLATSLIYWGLLVFLLTRFGLLAFAAQGFFSGIFRIFPLTTQSSAWYAGISLAGILLMAAIAFYGFYTSLGGRPVFGGALIEE